MLLRRPGLPVGPHGLGEQSGIGLQRALAAAASETRLAWGTRQLPSNAAAPLARACEVCLTGLQGLSAAASSPGLGRALSLRLVRAAESAVMLPVCLVAGCSPADARLAASAGRQAVTASGAAAARRAAPRRGTSPGVFLRATAGRDLLSAPASGVPRAQRFLGDGCTLLDCLGSDRAATLGVLPAQLLAAAGKPAVVAESRSAATESLAAAGFGAADLADDGTLATSEGPPVAWQSRKVAAAVVVLAELPWAGPLAVRLADEAVAAANSAVAAVVPELGPAPRC